MDNAAPGFPVGFMSVNREVIAVFCTAGLEANLLVSTYDNARGTPTNETFHGIFL
jgi:hypothetical protein